jgi:hypothetical protein
MRTIYLIIRGARMSLTPNPQSMINGNQGIVVAACILISIAYKYYINHAYSSKSKYRREIVPYERQGIYFRRFIL